MLLRLRYFILMLAASWLGGYAFAPWLSVPHAKIADDQYTGMSCEELRAESDRLLAEGVDLRPQLTPGRTCAKTSRTSAARWTP